MIPALGTEPIVAPADVLRVVAHEIRQPLSTIESIAYYLSLVPPRDDNKNQEQFERLRLLVEQSNWIISNGLQLAEPAIGGQPELIDIEEMITEAVSARPPLHSAPSPTLALAGGLPLVRLDPGLARALIENVLTLLRQISPGAHPANLRTSAGLGGGVLIEAILEISGYGSRAALPPGSSLSLDCARRIVEGQGGSFDFSVDAASGIRLGLLLRVLT